MNRQGMITMKNGLGWLRLDGLRPGGLGWSLSLAAATAPAAGGRGAAGADKAEEHSCLREALFPIGIFASWWLLYFC